MPYQSLRPSQVLLDPENPRLPDGTSDDRDAINRLLDDDAPSLIRLARDIVTKGRLNPAAPPIALQEGTKYLILDGNRRFAALKLLKDPTLADKEEHQKAFKRAATLGTPPQTVYTYVATDRADADLWIFLLHAGENRGIGVKPWNAEQKANYRKRAKKSVDSGTMRSIVIADELEEAYSSDIDLANSIRVTRTAKITNIGRFFSTDVMKRLHLTIEIEEGVDGTPQRTLHAVHGASQLRDFFIWAFKFIRENSVDAYKDAKIRKKVLDGVSDLIPRLSDALDAPSRLAGIPTAINPGLDQLVDVGDHDSDRPADVEEYTPDHADPLSNLSDERTEGEEPQEPIEDHTQQRGDGKKKVETKPERNLFQGLKLPNHPPRIQRLLKECRSLDVEASPGVACTMVRVLVELSVSSPRALALSGAGESDHLDTKIIRMLEHLDPDIERQRKRDSELAHAYLEAKELGVQYLHAFVHNPLLNPDPHLARRFSSAFRPFLLRIDEELA